MATPRRDTMDKGTSSFEPVIPEQDILSQEDRVLQEPYTLTKELAKAPIDTIIECMDTIHRASIDIPSSDELAQVLLCVQQLKDAIYMYTQVEAQRIVDDVDIDTNINE